MGNLGWEIIEDEKAAAAREAGCERQSRQEARRTKKELVEALEAIASVTMTADTNPREMAKRIVAAHSIASHALGRGS